MGDHWYYSQNNQQRGPVPLETLQDLVRTGQVQAHELAWREGMANWTPIAQLPEFGGLLGQVGTSQAPWSQPAPAPAPAPQPYPYQPLQYQSPAPMAGQVPTYLAQAILVTIFCCVPLGIVSIVFAAQVNGKLAAGDYAGAVDASNKARQFAWWSFGLGLGGLVLVVLFNVMAAAARF